MSIHIGLGDWVKFVIEIELANFYQSFVNLLYVKINANGSAKNGTKSDLCMKSLWKYPEKRLRPQVNMGM